ncbi:DUF305 domain-containing protein [Cellulomonas sp.]|uniref:DUF305 domain-containing protein n=1 Tax=Cellulomonas sp. TaxID=40001 RepID=UPI001B2BC8BA|nr:DUF305 domain-containing protein [Cellulomonas sp.]MBO9555033.1 DUF305 domain-containing protein [Cellulomonas sp.]
MTSARPRAAALVVTAVAVGWTVAACAGTAPDAPAGSSAAVSAARASEADVTFAQMMIVHHQGAVDMAALAPGRAGSQDVADLAARIEAAQQPEIDTMTGWLQEWGEPPLDDDGAMPGMDHGDMAMDGVGGMASMADMSGLEDASGADFDRLFLELMIVHHRGAVTMARTEVEHGRDPDAVALARKVITDQTGEIDEMERMLAASDGR